MKATCPLLQKPNFFEDLYWYFLVKLSFIKADYKNMCGLAKKSCVLKVDNKLTSPRLLHAGMIVHSFLVLSCVDYGFRGYK